MTELDEIIKKSLHEFVDTITREGWSGRREREAISLYVLAHLQHEAKPGSVLFDPLQIAIEFPVRQIDPAKQKAISKGQREPKRAVAKDLMIWPRPKMTTWTRDGRPYHAPIALLEWKINKSVPYEPDVKWLEEYTTENPRCVGYAVGVNQDKAGQFSVGVTRVACGKREDDWFVHIGRRSP